MNTLLTLPMVLALIGFLLSLAVHIGSLFGEKILPKAEMLHFGIFIVFIPAILSSQNILRNVRSNQKDLWKLLLFGCPPWMKKVSTALFVYAFVNFFYFIFVLTPGVRSHAYGSGMSVVELRGFSGHWMIFYWLSFAILYSKTRPGNPIIKTCPGCGSASSPFDLFCAKCGTKLGK